MRSSGKSALGSADPIPNLWIIRYWKKLHEPILNRKGIFCRWHLPNWELWAAEIILSIFLRMKKAAFGWVFTSDRVDSVTAPLPVLSHCRRANHLMNGFMKEVW